MATETTNYKLKKPELTDPVDISVLNENFDKIDEAVKKAADAIPPVATNDVAGIVKPDGTSITVDEDGTMHGAQTYQLPAATHTTLGGIMVGENLTISQDGKLNAYASVKTDEQPTKDSANVPLSGGTFAMIQGVSTRVSNLNEQVNVLTTGINWLTAVNSFADIATTYPSPSKGDTVMCKDIGIAYQFNGTDWIDIFTLLVPVATVAEVLAVLEGTT